MGTRPRGNTLGDDSHNLFDQYLQLRTAGLLGPVMAHPQLVGQLGRLSRGEAHLPALDTEGSSVPLLRRSHAVLGQETLVDDGIPNGRVGDLNRTRKWEKGELAGSRGVTKRTAAVFGA